jgi:hypothetical protein
MLLMPRPTNLNSRTILKKASLQMVAEVAVEGVVVVAVEDLTGHVRTTVMIVQIAPSSSQAQNHETNSAEIPSQ